MTVVDVIIPFSPEHSTEDEIERAIQSVEEQEIDTRVIKIVDKKQKGPAWARNQGLEKAENKYVAFLDADDYWKKEKLSRQLNKIREEDSGICLTRSEIKGREDPNPDFVGEEDFFEQMLYGKWVSLTSSILINTEKVSTKFNESIYRFEDHLFIMTAGNESGLSFVDEYLTVINKTDRGMSNNEDFIKKLKAKKEFFDELREEFDVLDSEKEVMANLYRWKGRYQYFDGENTKSLESYKTSLNHQVQIKTILAYSLTVSKMFFERVKNPGQKIKFLLGRE
jgi:glycosyltransferase involved in cell wall biosynthesis